MIKKKPKTRAPLVVARKILTYYIKRRKPRIFKGRDVVNHTSYTSMAEILPGLAILLDHRYIRKIDMVDSKKPGRTVSQGYEVNPKLFLNPQTVRKGFRVYRGNYSGELKINLLEKYKAMATTGEREKVKKGL